MTRPRLLRGVISYSGGRRHNRDDDDEEEDVNGVKTRSREMLIKSELASAESMEEKRSKGNPVKHQVIS